MQPFRNCPSILCSEFFLPQKVDRRDSHVGESSIANQKQSLGRKSSLPLPTAPSSWPSPVLSFHLFILIGSMDAMGKHKRASNWLSLRHTKAFSWILGILVWQAWGSCFPKKSKGCPDSVNLTPWVIGLLFYGWENKNSYIQISPTSLTEVLSFIWWASTGGYKQVHILSSGLAGRSPPQIHCNWVDVSDWIRCCWWYCKKISTSLKNSM